jgi:hypothetical protein
MTTVKRVENGTPENAEAFASALPFQDSIGRIAIQ